MLIILIRLMLHIASKDENIDSLLSELECKNIIILKTFQLCSITHIVKTRRHI